MSEKITFETDNEEVDEVHAIPFQTDEGAVDLYVLEETKLFGNNYILVTDDLESEEAYFSILKEERNEEDGIVSYTEIEDEKELEAVVKVFDELLEDIDLEV